MLELQVHVLKNLNDWEISKYENLLATLSLISLYGTNGQPLKTNSVDKFDF